MKITLETIDPTLSDVLTFLNSPVLPCTNKQQGKACTQQYNDVLDKDGRSLFWYGIDCELPRKRFCSACLAYWLVAVARNVISGIRRFKE